MKLASLLILSAIISAPAFAATSYLIEGAAAKKAYENLNVEEVAIANGFQKVGLNSYQTDELSFTTEVTSCTRIADQYSCVLVTETK